MLALGYFIAFIVALAVAVDARALVPWCLSCFGSFPACLFDCSAR